MDDTSEDQRVATFPCHHTPQARNKLVVTRWQTPKAIPGAITMTCSPGAGWYCLHAGDDGKADEILLLVAALVLLTYFLTYSETGRGGFEPSNIRVNLAIWAPIWRITCRSLPLFHISFVHVHGEILVSIPIVDSDLHCRLD